jgi:general secretion pathway protein K
MPGGGMVEATIRDGGNCFNINSVAEGQVPTALTPRPMGVDQFTGLMRVLEVPEREARRIAEAAGDWVDADMDRSREGAEDADYLGGQAARRVGNTFFAEVSELRALAGMTPEIYARLRPWLCALPVTDLSPININTLSPEQGPLLAMLAPGQISLEAARQAIAQRPAAGVGGDERILELAGAAACACSPRRAASTSAKHALVHARSSCRASGAELNETALVDARIAPARVVVRRWGSDD